MVGVSKIFAPDSGRSKVSTQIPSSPISRRIIGAVTISVIGFILASFSEIPSGERRNSDRILQDWGRPAPLFSNPVNPVGLVLPPAATIALRGTECYKARRRAVASFHFVILMVGKILQPEIRSLIDARDFGALREIFREWPPADVAEVILDMPEDEQVIIFRVLPNALAADVFE